MSLLAYLWSLPALDQHAHNVPQPHHSPPFLAGFSESLCPEVWQRDTPHGLFYRRSLKRLGSLLDCPPQEAAVLQARQRLGLERLTGLCLERAHLEGLLLDDGLNPETILPWSWHQRFVPTYRLLRLEALAEQLRRRFAAFEDWEEALRTHLGSTGPEVVGWKSIAAYRGGLQVAAVSRSEAKDAFARWPSDQRLGPGAVHAYLLHTALGLASHLGRPVQFHTGFGDPDLDLRQANPLGLRPLLEAYRCPFVLLHAGYPYMREAGYLASVYPHVWVDFGLAVPYLSTAGMREAVGGLLELAPLNKVMYSSDASLLPDLFYLGAVHGREVLAWVLEQAVEHGDLDWSEAEQAGRWILAQNARRLYWSEGEATASSLD